MSVEIINASDALDSLRTPRYALIDVRSEGEFSQGHIPGFINAPILTDEERHRVGITYKEKGSAAATELGHQLVGPHRSARVDGWNRLAAKASNGALVTCWRGGLRSQIASQWLHSTGVRVQRVEGGYKAMRRELMSLLETPPSLNVITGLTGSGKTRLLQKLAIKEKIDLEGLACHRGSSFGGRFKQAQPGQASFENAVALGLRGATRSVLVEDESVTIGSLHLPAAVRRAIVSTPVVYLEVELDVRTQNIFEEYVAEPLMMGIDADQLRDALVGSVGKLARRLGGALTADLIKKIEQAFEGGKLDADRHGDWIKTLLTQYYDKSYTYAFKRLERKVLFQGRHEECEQWILHQYA